MHSSVTTLLLVISMNRMEIESLQILVNSVHDLHSQIAENHKIIQKIQDFDGNLSRKVSEELSLVKTLSLTLNRSFQGNFDKIIDNLRNNSKIQSDITQGLKQEVAKIVKNLYKLEEKNSEGNLTNVIQELNLTLSHNFNEYEQTQLEKFGVLQKFFKDSMTTSLNSFESKVMNSLKKFDEKLQYNMTEIKTGIMEDIGEKLKILNTTSNNNKEVLNQLQQKITNDNIKVKKDLESMRQQLDEDDSKYLKLRDLKTELCHVIDESEQNKTELKNGSIQSPHYPSYYRSDEHKVQ